MKRKLLCALLTGAMVLSAGSAVLADEAESETSNVNEDGSVNDPSKCRSGREQTGYVVSVHRR